MTTLRKTIGPRMVGTLSASTSGGSTVNLSWPEAIDNVGAVTYTVTRSPTPFPSAVTTTSLTYTDTGASGNPTYSVTATDARGLTSSPALTAGVVINDPAKVLDTRFAGLSLVQTNSYTNGIERRFDGTDSVTGQVFSNTSPQLWGGQTTAPVIQFLANTPSTAWDTEFVTNAPGGYTALRVRRNEAFTQPPAHQAAYRIRSNAIWSLQTGFYIRRVYFIPSAFPTANPGFFVRDEVKVNGAGETEDRLLWGFTKVNYNGVDTWMQQVAATWTNGTNVGTWTTAPGTMSPPQTTLSNGSYFKLGALQDGDGTSLPEAGKWIMDESYYRLQDGSGRVQGNAPAGAVWCATAVGTATTIPVRGTATQRFFLSGRNMTDLFAASAPSGAAIVFPFNLYSNFAIQGLDFYLHSLEVYTDVPPDASPHPSEID